MKSALKHRELANLFWALIKVNFVMIKLISIKAQIINGSYERVGIAFNSI